MRPKHHFITHTSSQGWFKPSQRNIVVFISRVTDFQTVTENPVLRFHFAQKRRPGLRCYVVTVSEGGDKGWTAPWRARTEP
jgi:hypothetical protein